MIEFRSVSKAYGDTWAVRDVDLLIRPREITVLVGPSGCGKTTLLRMINRMIDPTHGEILIDGEDIAGLDPVPLRRRIGYVLQHAGLLPHRTIAENVATIPRLTGTPRIEARRRAIELLTTVGLDAGLADRYPRQLSGGQQQRVGVARALAMDPNILLMDEPFGAVDPIVRAELQQELLRIQSTVAKTIVFVTHDIDEAFLLADTVILLQPGARIAQAGSPAELLTRPASAFVSEFIGADRGKRRLRIDGATSGGEALVVDGTGRPAGVLDPDALPTGEDR